MEGPRVKVDGLLRGVLYKEDDGPIFTWSVMNTYNTDWVVPGDQYNKKLKSWKGPIHNGHFRAQAIKKIITTERICSKFSGSFKYNIIPIKVNQ